MREQTTLVATLGGQPQIITFTLDLLKAKDYMVDQVVVVYLASNPRYYQAYRRLMEEFVGDCYLGQPCHLRGVPVCSDEIPIDDAISPSQVGSVHRTFQQLMGELASQRQQIHLSLSGGRRILALVALEAAMRYLKPTDKVWHIYTPNDLTEQARSGKLLHAPPESGLRLIEVPFVAWVSMFPGLASLLSQSPQELREAELGYLGDNERERCRQVWNNLTSRQRDVLRCFAEGLDRAQTAEKLFVKISTVDSHKSIIFEECQATWGKKKGEIDALFLQQRFAPFLKGLDML